MQKEKGGKRTKEDRGAEKKNGGPVKSYTIQTRKEARRSQKRVKKGDLPKGVRKRKKGAEGRGSYREKKKGVRPLMVNATP